MDRATAIVAQVQFGERRLVAARECRLDAAFLLQLRENEFDVLAGAQLVGGVIGAGAIVVTRQFAAYRYTIGTLRLRVADAELRKEGFRADIFQLERLLATELTAQCALPFKRGNFRRCMSS